MGKPGKVAWGPLALGVGLGGIIIAGITVALMKKPRGLRANNPFNLVDNGINWEGLDSPRNDAADHQADIEAGHLPLLRFISPYYGIRAGMIDVAGDLKEKVTTIASLVHEYAPASDGNDEADYRAFLAEKLGRDENTPLDPARDAPAIAEFIVQMEQGTPLTGLYGAATVAAGVTAGLEHVGLA